MLTEERYEIILKMLEEQKSVTLQELKDRLDTSESTVRRDLNALHNSGKLVKVFGGAVAVQSRFNTRDDDVAFREELNRDEKRKIAQFAASLIGPDDFVFLDAGTTTGFIPEFITEKTAVFVTNAPQHARNLAAAGVRVYLIGGEVKAATEAVAGTEAVENLEKYHFTLGFFGTNGVSVQYGFTTPELNEAIVKKKAFENTKRVYVLADHEKLNKVSSVTFGRFESAAVIVDRIDEEEFKNCDNIIDLSKQLL